MQDNDFLKTWNFFMFIYTHSIRLSVCSLNTGPVAPGQYRSDWASKFY